MSGTSREEIESTVESLVDDVGSWPGVTVGEHRFGGTEWRVVPREIGHVHAWGRLDIAYLRALRDVLVEEGETGVRHLLDQSGWTTFYIEHPDDFDYARWLVRLSYPYHVNASGRRQQGSRSTLGSMSNANPTRSIPARRPGCVRASASRKSGTPRDVAVGGHRSDGRLLTGPDFGDDYDVSPFGPRDPIALVADRLERHRS